MNQLATYEQEDEIFLSLTPRQSQVLKLICHRGLSNKAIGNILKISESTVKIHTSAVLKRYGVKNRTQLVLAYSNKLKA
jgi:two-component system nitrate/nitrite response regulator NarP